MSEKGFNPNFLETPQQELQELISHESKLNPELQYALDRSCTPHCVEAIAELQGLHIESLDRLDEYVDFLRDHGPHPENGSNNHDIYGVDDGWYNVAIADLLRMNGFHVVSQNLTYDTGNSNFQQAVNSGRARGEWERDTLSSRMRFGGSRGKNWLEALSETLADGGYPIVSIKIPSSKKAGEWGQHSVVVTGYDDYQVYYFDPDGLALDRYKDNADEQQISRQDESKLIYTQDSKMFLNRMTGEVMHIFTPAKQ